MGLSKEELLTCKELAKTLKVSERTLARWRDDETGPPWIRLSRDIRYRTQDVHRWLMDRQHGEEE